MEGKIIGRQSAELTAVFTCGGGKRPPDYVLPDSQDQIPRVRYSIRFIPKDAIWRRRALALEYLIHRPVETSISKVILGIQSLDQPDPRAIIDDASFDFPEAKFTATPNQTRAVNSGLSGALTLIQRPSGSGKTAVIASLCVVLLSRPDQAEGRILVCGISNLLVDNLVRAIFRAMKSIGRSLV
jgi:hypothetical protein